MRTDWNVLYRKKKTGTILNDTDTPFTVLKNSLRYWAADPFVFEENGETYIFAELYDKFTLKGTLGYCKYKGNGFTSWKSVIREDHHLSFPNIFKLDGDIFIMPESFQSKQIYLYKAVSFPDKWVKYKVLYEGKELSDTVILKANGTSHVFTSETDVSSGSVVYRLFKGKADNDGMIGLEDEPISEDISSSRPGGNFFEYNGSVIRVSQNCLGNYGAGLVFSEVDSDFINGSSDVYKEKIIKRISPEDIKTDCGTKIYGTHTYNSNGTFEVIDIKSKRPKSSSLVAIPCKIIKKLKKKKRK